MCKIILGKHCFGRLVLLYISQIVQCQEYYLFNAHLRTFFFFIAFRERGGERVTLMREGSVDWVPPTGIVGAQAGTELQPRYEPGQRIKPAAFPVWGDAPATPARAKSIHF